MHSPSKTLATLRPELALLFMEWNREMSRRGFISQRVLPVREVTEQAGTLPHIPLEQLLKGAQTRRNAGGDYNRVGFTFGDKSYACERHGIEVPIDDYNAAKYRHFFDAETVAVMLAYNTVMTAAEKRAAALIFNTTTWTGSALSTAVGTEWSVLATATPVDDVAAAKNRIWVASGLVANALIICYPVWENLRRVKQIKDDVASAGAGSSSMAGDISVEMVARALGLDFLFVAGAPENTANEAAARSLAPIWDDEYAMVCRVVTQRFAEVDPGIGITAHWGEDGSEVGGMVETYRDEPVGGDVVRVRHDVDELLLYKEAGHLLSNITA